MNSLFRISLAAAVVLALLFISRQMNEAQRLETENQRLRQRSEETLSSGPSSPREPARRRTVAGKESSPGPAAAARKALMSRMKMAQTGWHTDDFNHILFEKGGRGVTDSIAEVAGLTVREKEAVSGALMKFWNIASEDFARRATLVEDDSDPQAGRTVYMITARPDRGREFNEQLLDDLGKAVDLPKLEILIKGYLRSFTLGAFGANDVRLEFTAGEDEFIFAYLNPLDGDETYFGSKPLAEFGEEFGNSFEIPSAAGPDSKDKE